MPDMNQNTKPDWISRRVEDFLKLVGAIGKDTKSAVIVCLILLAGWQYREMSTMHKTINDEIRKQVPTAVKKEAEEQFKEPKAQIDTAVGLIKESINFKKEEQDSNNNNQK